MERSFVLVLTLVTLVVATPHGYGVKGGASAKAEASAVAGAFGGLGGPLPLSIPSGSSYSGSFAKSSSASFASSSASASSSSYSFSGSGANGVASGSDKGCSTGPCSGVGEAGTSGPTSNGLQQSTGANAVAAAQAKALSGSYTPCQGSSCNGSPAGKCTSGQCSPDSSLKSQNECEGNENCKTPSSATDISNQGSASKDEKDKLEGNLNDSNDFAVNINRNSQSKLSHDSNGQYSNKDKSYNTQSDCSHGKCGAGSTGHSSFGSNQNKHPVPSTFLTTPNTNPPCTTPDCHYSSPNSDLQTNGLPSSYNVPIQSATNPPNTYYSSPSGVPCTSPNCNSAPNNAGPSNIPTHHLGQQGPINQGLCSSGQCNVPSLNGQTNSGAPSNTKLPNYSQGSSSSNLPSGYSGQPGCKTGYCSGLPTYPSPPTNHPDSGCSGVACGGTSLTGSQPSSKPSGSDAPVYTGGFGGPPGFLDTSSGFNKVPVNLAADHSHSTPIGSKPSGTYGTTNSNTLNSNTNYGSSQSSGSGVSAGEIQYNKPSNGLSTPGFQSNPSVTGSYGVPTASSPVPLSSFPHPEYNGIHKPTASYSGSSPTYSEGFEGSTGLSQSSSGSDSIHGSFGVTKPNKPSTSLSTPAYTGGFSGPSAPSGSGSFGSSPSYHGGFDGSTGSSHTSSGSNTVHGSFGVTKPNTSPNSQSSPAYTSGFGGTSGGSSQSYGSPESLNKPSSGSCGSAGCNSQIDSIEHGGSHDKTNLGTSTSSQNKPTYSAGFGGPNGFLSPNNVNVPSNTPTAPSGNIPCVSGNCGSVSPTSTQGNVHSLAAATASANAEIYSGGFGGPPGFLKPYDDGKVTPAHGSPANGRSLSSNNGQPNTPSTVNGKNSEHGSSVNGANAAAHASATASATAGSYGGNNSHNGASHGCNSGCSPTGNVDGNFGLPAGFTKNGLGAGSLASAKSSAGANAYGNFASSSASAQASAGVATKGGYGRK